jgi:hypothetical protein
MTCPKCGSSDIRTSKSAHWNDVFQRVRGREALRCRKCRLRFFASNMAEPGSERVIQSKHTPRSAKLMSPRTKKHLVRRLIVISIFAVAFVLFLFFLRYLTTERMPASDSGAVSSPFACSSTESA